MLSICITVKNRSRVRVNGHELLLLPNCVRSITESTREGIPCEIVVTDWDSDDWPVEDWLEAMARPIPVQIIKVEGKFSRGRGRNIAAKAAKGEKLLFLDADSLLCPALLTRGNQYLAEGKAYFPIIYSFSGPEHSKGSWTSVGYGNCMLNKDTYERSEGWPEYTSWGGEDNHFFDDIASFVEVVREKVPGFYHQWHPDDIDWRNRYSDSTICLEEFEHKLQKFNQKVKLMEEDLKPFLTPVSQLIVVDENKLEGFLSLENPLIPFLEKNGEYYGLPADSETAIQELERMRQEGASHIVFVWMSFWWLDDYKSFWQYLKSQYSCILDNHRCVVFDLCSVKESE